MAQTCASPKCNRTARGVCDCCKQHLCLLHLGEHNAVLLSQLTPLTDNINVLGDRLNHVDVGRATEECREKLNRWRQECYSEIDRVFELKCRQLETLLCEKRTKAADDLGHAQMRVNELIRAQEATQEDLNTLKSIVQQLECRVEALEQPRFDANARPLTLPEDFVSVYDCAEQTIDLSSLSGVLQSLRRSHGSYAVLACNEQHVLVHRKPNLCLLDREMNIVKRAQWFHEKIHDICWSKTLEKFIAIQINAIYLVDKSTLTAERVQTMPDGNLTSCACSDTSLFVSTNDSTSAINRYDLLASVQAVQRWTAPQTCSSAERIQAIACGAKTLALLIHHPSERTLRLELRAVETLGCIWSFCTDIIPVNTQVFRCCALAQGEWLLTDRLNGRLLHIDRDGKSKNTISYQPNPHRVVLLEPNTLVIATKIGMNFHNLLTTSRPLSQ